MSSDDSRYDEIMRRIAARQPADFEREQSRPAAPPNDLASILDGLNAWGCMESVTKRGLPRVNSFGPRALQSAPILPEWVGVVSWHKRRGYYAYKTLWLLGVWAIAENDGSATIAVGVKTLAFDAPVYNPESYFHHIKKRFDIYYPEDGSPPTSADRRFSATYDPAQRLRLRDKLQGVLETAASAL